MGILPMASRSTFVRRVTGLAHVLGIAFSHHVVLWLHGLLCRESLGNLSP
jgi:hypothetical protein